MDKSKLILPISILLASLILGGFFYASQINKQQSIEKQQRLKLMQDLKIEQEKAERIEREKQAEADEERAKENFSNNLKCQTLLKDLKQRWNNVAGIYYDEWRNTCIVKYVEEGEIKEAPLENMQDN
jgi:uncharacterized protein YaiL (DUF2058 family)